MYCFCIMFIDFIFLVLILLFQESFLNEGHSLKYVIIILTSFFIIMSFLLFCIKKTILSNILMFTYEGGSGLYLLISVFFQVKEMITNNNNRYKKEYRDNNYQTIVLISFIATIFLKIFSYYNLKEYCKMVDKRETFIRDNQHEEFLEDLQNVLLTENTNDNNIDNKKLGNSAIDMEKDIIEIYSEHIQNIKKNKK